MVIRAMQAGIGCFVGKKGTLPVRKDSLGELIRQTEYCLADQVKISGLLKPYDYDHRYTLTPDLEATVCSVYTYLTGKEKEFPDPYRIKRQEEKASVETVTVRESDSQDQTGEECLPESDLPEEDTDVSDYDFSDDYLYDPWEDESEEESRARMLASYAAEEEEQYYHGDALSHADWENDIGPYEYTEDISEWKRRHITDLSDDKEKERYEAQARRLRIFFPNKEEFVRHFDHLCEITSSEHAGLLRNLEDMVEGWLKKKDLMLYCCEEDYREIYDRICKISDRSQLCQEKKL